MDVSKEDTLRGHVRTDRDDTGDEEEEEQGLQALAGDMPEHEGCCQPSWEPCCSIVVDDEIRRYEFSISHIHDQEESDTADLEPDTEWDWWGDDDPADWCPGCDHVIMGCTCGPVMGPGL